MTQGVGSGNCPTTLAAQLIPEGDMLLLRPALIRYHSLIKLLYPRSNSS